MTSLADRIEGCDHSFVDAKPFRFYRASATYKRRVRCRDCPFWWTDEQTFGGEPCPFCGGPDHADPCEGADDA